MFFHQWQIQLNKAVIHQKNELNEYISKRNRFYTVRKKEKKKKKTSESVLPSGHVWILET
jgi:3,4-dihydroxy-2-butanone 4-phosphate synthase